MLENKNLIFKQKIINIEHFAEKYIGIQAMSLYLKIMIRIISSKSQLTKSLNIKEITLIAT